MHRHEWHLPALSQSDFRAVRVGSSAVQLGSKVCSWHSSNLGELPTERLAAFYAQLAVPEHHDSHCCAPLGRQVHSFEDEVQRKAPTYYPVLRAQNDGKSMVQRTLLDADVTLRVRARALGTLDVTMAGKLRKDIAVGKTNRTSKVVPTCLHMPVHEETTCPCEDPDDVLVCSAATRSVPFTEV